MTCTMCRHKFCWICEKDWELGLDHSKCWDKRREMNKLERRSVVDNVRLADEETLEARKFRLAFEQFNRYEREQKCAENQLNGVMEPQLISSYEQLIECRKVLKNAHVFMHLHDKGKCRRDGPVKAENKIQFDFGNYLGMLERFTEKLSVLLLQPFNKVDKLDLMDTTTALHKALKLFVNHVRDEMF